MLCQIFVDVQHLKTMQRFKQLLSIYQQNKDLINIGAYTPGANADTDAAIERQPHLRRFIEQSMGEAVSFDVSIATLQAVITPSLSPPQMAPPVIASGQPVPR